MANHHGDFIWYELITTDADAAGDFYGKVVGWHSDKSDQPGMDYRMLRMDGEDPVAGLMPISAMKDAVGVQPGWLGYIGVDDVDKTAARSRRAAAQSTWSRRIFPMLAASPSSPTRRVCRFM